MGCLFYSLFAYYVNSIVTRTYSVCKGKAFSKCNNYNHSAYCWFAYTHGIADTIDKIFNTDVNSLWSPFVKSLLIEWILVYNMLASVDIIVTQTYLFQLCNLIFYSFTTILDINRIIDDLKTSIRRLYSLAAIQFVVSNIMRSIFS